MIEVIRQLPETRRRLRVAILDFDGTISTLRHGWEQVMEPLMVEMICGDVEPVQQIIDEWDT